MDLVSQDLGAAELGGSGSGFPWGCSQYIIICCIIWGLDWAEGATSKMAHSHGCWPQKGCSITTARVYWSNRPILTGGKRDSQGHMQQQVGALEAILEDGYCASEGASQHYLREKNSRLREQKIKRLWGRHWSVIFQRTARKMAWLKRLYAEAEEEVIRGNRARLNHPGQWFSQWDPETSSISITREPGNISSQPFLSSWVSNPKGGPREVLTSPPDDCGAHLGLRINALGS